jgi:hypothetical protein
MLSLPAHFTAPDIRVAGIRATEVFTLGEALAASIEDQVVVTLNRIRRVWDPEDQHPLLAFERQPQTFPDVRLRNTADGTIGLGIELKGWYILAKEGEPNFRFQVTPAVCDPHDLLVTVPWYFSDVISGTPRLLRPFVLPARYAAEYRNWWWQHERRTKESVDIRSPTKPVAPYPDAREQVLDAPAADKGKNFGRIARTGIMAQFVNEMLDALIAGIPARAWYKFFRIFTQEVTPEDVASALRTLRTQVQRKRPDPAIERAQRIVEVVAEELAVPLN